MPGVLARMPRRSAGSRVGIVPAVLARMPRRVAGLVTRPMPGVLGRMPRRSVWAPLAAACPAQPAVPADRPCRCAQDRWFFNDQRYRSINVILVGAAS